MKYEIKINDQYQSKEIYFEGIPTKETRDNLKALKFRWNPKKSCWYGYAEEDELKKAITEVVKLAPIEKTEIGTIYEGWRGTKSREWHSDQELKGLLMEDLKKAGIKASIRFNRAGWLTSLTMTITVKADMIKSFEEYKKDFQVESGWYNYKDASATNGYSCIHAEKFWNMDSNAQETKDLFENIARTAYDEAVERLHTNDHYGFNPVKVLTDEGNALFEMAREIVSQYNHDNSDTMTDYFDRGIYDHYRFKIA